MLTAQEPGSYQYRPVFRGSELADAAQIERLQQALLSLSKTGMSWANPGTVDGVLKKQTVFAVCAVAKDLDIGTLLKGQLYYLAIEAAQALGNEITSYLSGAADDAYASLVQIIDASAPGLTAAVLQLTQKRTAQAATPSTPSTPVKIPNLLSSRGLPTVKTYDQPTAAQAPALVRAEPTSAKAVVKYAAVGAGVIGLGVAAWFLLR